MNSYSQELFKRSEKVLGCIPSPMFRVIHRSLIFEAIEKQRRSLLREILEAIAVQGVITLNPWSHKEKSIKSKEEKDAYSSKISKLATVLDRLEQAHRQENETLVEANQDFKNPGLNKVSKMLDKIRKVKEARGTFFFFQIYI